MFCKIQNYLNEVLFSRRNIYDNLHFLVVSQKTEPPENYFHIKNISTVILTYARVGAAFRSRFQSLVAKSVQVDWRRFLKFDFLRVFLD